jgi:lysophospholipase L1-like esterase
MGLMLTRIWLTCLVIGTLGPMRLSIAAPPATTRPTLFLIGDSTVRNGSGTGAGGLWGWGAFLGDHFDVTRIRIVNRALGGRSSRTFLTEGLWERVLQEIRPGDFVMIQFGHNDGGPPGTGPPAPPPLGGRGPAPAASGA